MTYLYAASIVTALLALAVVALQHAEFFKKIYWPLVVAAMLLFLASVVWNISSSTTASELLPFVRDEAITDALASAESAALPALWSSLVYLGFVIYLGLLALIPAKAAERHVLQSQTDH